MDFDPHATSLDPSFAIEVPKVYRPVGHCIYCRSDGGGDGLRKEHVVPLSLGGTLVLEDASCSKCEAITSYLDGYLSRQVYADLRNLSNAKGRKRRGKNKRKETKALTFRFADGSVEIHELAAKYRPLAFGLPIPPPPGLMVGRSRYEPAKEASVGVYGYDAQDRSQMDLITKGRASEIVHEVSVNWPTFGRAIARIGYCMGVWQLGANGFDGAPLCAVIMGEGTDDPYYYVGCLPDQQPADRRGPGDSLNLRLYTGMMEGTDARYRFVQVRPFANLSVGEPTPVYTVIIGAPKA